MQRTLYYVVLSFLHNRSFIYGMCWSRQYTFTICNPLNVEMSLWTFEVTLMRLRATDLEKFPLKRYCINNLKLAYFVLYLKIINIFLKISLLYASHCELSKELKNSIKI